MLWREQEHETVTERRWDPEAARQAVAAIVADAEHTADERGWRLDWSVHLKRLDV